MVFALNPRRKRRRSYNRRRKASHRRRRNGRSRFRYSRRRHRNPGLGSITGSMTSAFDVGLLQEGALIVGGSIGTNFLTKILVRFVPVDFLKTSPGNYATELVAAGLLGGLTRKFMPRIAGPVFLGGILDVLMRATNQYIIPIIGLTPLKGLADYLTVGGAAGARPLMGLSDDMDGLRDYLTVGGAAGARPLMGLSDDELDGMSDYLTVGGAAGARPLMGMSMGEETVGSELEG